MARFDANAVAPIKATPPSLAALREQLKVKSAPSGKELVQLKFKGTDETLTVEVREITSGQKWEIADVGFREVRNDAGKLVEQVLPKKFYPPLVMFATFDPSSGERVFTSVEEVNAMDMDVLNQITEPALRLAGWSKDEEDTMEGNSSQGATDDSNSTLQIVPE